VRQEKYFDIEPLSLMGSGKAANLFFLSGKSFFMSGNYFLCRDNNKRANIGKNRVIFGANGSFK